MDKHTQAFTERHLRPGETIAAAEIGVLAGVDVHRGAMIVTSSRVVFYRKGFFGEVLRSLERGSITAFERSSSFGQHSIEIRSSSAALVFKRNHGKETIDAIVRALEG